MTELRLLVTHRTDLVGDWVRMVNRLRDVLSGYFPALERSFDCAHRRGALVLLTSYQTPQAIRRTGESRLRAWLARITTTSRAHHQAEIIEPARHGSDPGAPSS